MRKISYLMVALMLAVGSMTMVHAEGQTGASGWHVSFDGSEMKSTFKTDDVQDKLEGLQPGDSMRFEVSLENTYNEATDWYMTNEVLRSFEQSVKSAASGGYTYRLAYYDDRGTETLLYDSSAVGGDKVISREDLLGLNEATDNMEDFFYLDTIDAKKTGKIILDITLDGETQGNYYQDTNAALQMNFAVELAETTVNEVTEKVPGKTTISRPKTGDDTDIMPYMMMALASGLILVGYIGYRTKKEKGGEAR